MKRLTPLTGSGTDQHDVASRRTSSYLSLHLGDGVLDQRKHAVKVDGHGVAPLLVGHLVDSYVFGRPDTVVGDQNVKSAETAYNGVDELARRLGAGQITEHRSAAIFATLLHQLFRVGFGLLIIEDHARAGGGKHADRRGADAA